MVLRAIAEGLISKDCFYRLVSPNNYKSATKAIDYILAALADMIRMKNDGESLEEWKSAAAQETRPAIIELVEQAGAKLNSSNADLKRILNDLRKAKSIVEIRNAWLRVIRNNSINWLDFIGLNPPENNMLIFTIRDYMLAFLYDSLREELSSDDIIGEDEEIGVSNNEEEYICLTL